MSLTGGTFEHIMQEITHLVTLVMPRKLKIYLVASGESSAPDQDAGQTKYLETQSVFPQSTSVATGFPLSPSQPQHNNTLLACAPLPSRQLKAEPLTPPTHSTS